MNFKSLDLPFDYIEYSPVLSAEIMKFHYEKHYLGYLNNLNNALNKYPQFFNFSIEDLLYSIDMIPSDITELVRNNGGGYSNHTLFWEVLNPKNPKNPSLEFEKIIAQEFLNFENLKTWLIQKGTEHFGSGWVWLVLDQNQKMWVYSLPNQDSPYMEGHIPLLGIDVWEHAYYLQYKNIKTDYLKKIFEIIDWSVVEKRYHDIVGCECC